MIYAENGLIYSFGEDGYIVEILHGIIIEY